MNTNAKTKVLYVITKSNWGGAQKYVLDLATALPKEGFEIAVALGGTGERGAPTGELAKRLSESGIRTIQVRHFARNIFLLDDLRAFFELFDIFRTERPTVIHLNSSKAGGLGALAGLFAGVRTRIFTVHGLALHEERSAFERLLIFIASWLTFFFATHAIVLNELDRRTISNWPLAARKLHLVRNGITPPSFLPSTEARGALAAFAGKPELAEISCWLGTISELHPNKGLEYMLEACATLKRDGHTFIFYVIGTEGGARSQLEERVRELGLSEQVVLQGPVPDAARYLQAFDVFTLSSVKEGLPYVLLEAALAERAIVATNVGGISEILDAESGHIVAAKDARALAGAIAPLLRSSEERHSLGRAAHDRVVRMFSKDAMLAATMRLYNSR